MHDICDFLTYLLFYIDVRMDKGLGIPSITNTVYVEVDTTDNSSHNGEYMHGHG